MKRVALLLCFVAGPALAFPAVRWHHKAPPPRFPNECHLCGCCKPTAANPIKKA